MDRWICPEFLMASIFKLSFAARDYLFCHHKTLGAENWLRNSNLFYRKAWALEHRRTALMSVFQSCLLWDSDKVYQNLIFDTFIINDPHQCFNTSKVNAQNIVFCIKWFFLVTSFTRFLAISFCFLAVISKPNLQFRQLKDKKFDFGSYLVISIEKTQGNSI